MLPVRVTIYEVGPRDGLQNESANLSVEARLRLIAALAGAGVRRIELGSFVRPEWIPQLADTDEVARRVVRRPEMRYAALVPNRAGLDRALATGMREIALFMSATETHNRKNTNKTIAQSLELFAELVPVAKKNGLFVRAYLSTIWGCPYEGKVDPKRAACSGAAGLCWVIGRGASRSVDVVQRDGAARGGAGWRRRRRGAGWVWTARMPPRMGRNGVNNSA